MKYWIYKTIYYCPLCASSTEYRERMYTPKPEDWYERNKIIDSWDSCGAL